jgi:uncharacterized protein YbjT (DUF2867 family)
MSRTVLVLAATGTTGRPAVSALLERGATVRAATRDPATAALPVGATAVAFDIDDRATWGPALAGVDALYFALPPFRADEAEVGRALLDAAHAAGVSRIVKLSAKGVEHDPESGHRKLELHIEGLGVSWVTLRPTFFMDNFIHFYGDGVRQGVVALPTGEGETSFVAAADIGAVAAEALLGDEDGAYWTLTGPESLSFGAAVARLGRVIGRPVRFVDAEPAAHTAQMQAWGMPPTAVQTMSMLYEMVRNNGATGTVPTVERVLGRPATPLADWARAHAAAW